MKLCLQCTDVTLLAESIAQLSVYTRLARTAQWAALQMADKGNSKLTQNLLFEEYVDLSPYTKPTPHESSPPLESLQQKKEEVGENDVLSVGKDLDLESGRCVDAASSVPSTESGGEGVRDEDGATLSEPNKEDKIPEVTATDNESCMFEEADI